MNRGRARSVFAPDLAGRCAKLVILSCPAADQAGRYAKQADPEGLVTYANFPPTEYLDLPFLDFVTFNVYLHDRETFRRYLFRLQHKVGDRPLVLLISLEALDYPDYEVIVVDDGSTDDTRAIVNRFPAVTAIHQQNLGLSVARNVGLQAATGSIVAYTDSDCFADPDWLTHLVDQLERSGAAAVGDRT